MPLLSSRARNHSAQRSPEQAQSSSAGHAQGEPTRICIDPLPREAAALQEAVSDAVHDAMQGAVDKAVQGAVAETLPDAVQAAVADRLRFDVRANVLTLLAITGVIMYWRGIWSLWDLLVGDSLWSNLASVALGLAVMIFFRLAGVPLLGALPSG